MAGNAPAATAPRTESAPPRRRRARWRRIAARTTRTSLATVWLTARIGVIVAVIALAAAWRVYDLAPYAVTSGSMEPAIPVGALVLVEQVPAERVRVGDVITFRPAGRSSPVTHRVVSLSQRDGNHSFVTKGDANRTADDWRLTNPTSAGGPTDHADPGPGVSYENGKALRVRATIPFAGYLIEVARRPWLQRLLLALPLLVIGAWVLRWIWRTPPVELDAAPGPTQPPSDPQRERGMSDAA